MSMKPFTIIYSIYIRSIASQEYLLKSRDFLLEDAILHSKFLLKIKFINFQVYAT